MNALWSYFSPSLAAGAGVGVIAGAIAFRRRKKRVPALVLGCLAALLLAMLWHGPLGGAGRFAAQVEGAVRRTLVHYEMMKVSGHLRRNPLTRDVLLAGPADDFQRTGLVDYIDQIPGVRSTRWDSGGRGLPLIAEGLIASVLGFLLGLLLAYLVELRRRYNAQWNW